MRTVMNVPRRLAPCAIALATLLGGLAGAAHAQAWQAGSRTPTQQQSGTNRSGNLTGTVPGYGQGYGSGAVVTSPYGSTSSLGTAATGNSGPQSVGPVDTGTTATDTQWRSTVRQPVPTNGGSNSGYGYGHPGYNGRGYNYGGYGYGGYGGYGSSYDEGTTPQFRGDPAQRYNDPYRYSNPYGPPVRNDCVNVNGAPIPC